MLAYPRNRFMSNSKAKKQTKKSQTKKKSQSQKKKVDNVQEQHLAQPVSSQVIDLDVEVLGEQSEHVSTKKPGLGLRLHALNVQLPWLKVLLLVILAVGVAFGVEELLRHNANPPMEPAVTAGHNGIVEVPPEKIAEPDDKPVNDSEQPSKPNESDDNTSAKPVPPSTDRKLVALTFDDGPSPTQTPRLLQILRDKGVKVTFFVVGSRAQKSPEILRQEEADGHEVASHTMTHANLKRSTVEAIKWEAAAMNGLFTEILGHGPSLTRPPYGNISNDTRTYINQPLILWTVDPEDWKYKDANIVHKNIVNSAFDGAIILMHDIHATTVDAVARVIDDLRAAGYEFMTVSELAAARGVVLQNGVSYGSFRP